MVRGSVDGSPRPWGWVARLASGRISTVDDPARAYLPFDVDAIGHMPGDGGALFVLEDEEGARERGVTSWHGEVAGYAATFDPRPGLAGRRPCAGRHRGCVRGRRGSRRARPRGGGGTARGLRALRSAGDRTEDGDRPTRRGWATALRDGDLLETEFKDLGSDSPAMLETAARIQIVYGVVPADDVVVEAGTPRELLPLVNRSIGEGP